MAFLKITSLLSLCILLCQCGSTSRHNFGRPNMGGPAAEARAAKIASEPIGNFYYGRRYHVQKTRFWGYLRKPRQPASTAKLVMFKEHRKRAPDRLPENGSTGARYGFDNNYEYRIHGYYSGKEAYDPNSNRFVPIFVLTDYKLVDKDPGWLFSPKDHFDPYRITLYP